MEISRNNYRSLWVTLIAFLLVGVPAAFGEVTFEQQARLVSGNVDDGYANIGVGISSNTAVVASAVGYYVYIRSGTTWLPQTTLIPSDGMAGCGFPAYSAIEGNTIVVGCMNTTIGTNVNQGAVYVFVRSGEIWTEQQRLTASDGAAGDNFGRSVAIKGETVIVSAPRNDIGGNTDQGAAYIFNRTNGTWIEQIILAADNPAAFNYFGDFVSIDSDYLAVSTNPNPGAGANSVYLFAKIGGAWSFQQRLSNCEPSGSGSQCQFGRSLSIQDDRLLVGNRFLNVGPNQAQGGVYFYLRSGATWSQQQRITAGDGLTNDGFGGSLSVNDDTLIIGAAADIGFPGKADVYHLTGNQWVFHDRLETGGTTRNAFGQNLSFDGDSIIIAAAVDAGSPGQFIGAAYVFGPPVIAVTDSLFDYDGDGRADLSVRRPSDNVWYLLRATAGYTAQQFGVAGDRMTPSDYDGDGTTDVSVFRPSTGQWFMFMSQTQTFEAFGWGENGDLPVPTDRDNDGRTDLVIFRPSNNTWYTRYANATFNVFTFGEAGDKPVVGDFDEDGIGDVALFRPSNNNWYIIKSSLGFFIQTWGEAGDIPVTGDFDGDGATDQAVFRPSTGQWFKSQTTAGFESQTWGQNGDVPVAADYDGDGRADVAVFRPSNGTWYIINSTAGILVQQFGQNGDVPTQSAFVY